MDNKKDNSNRVWSIEQLQLAIELESANPNQLAKKSLYTHICILNTCGWKKENQCADDEKNSRTRPFRDRICMRANLSCVPRGGKPRALTRSTVIKVDHRSRSRPVRTEIRTVGGQTEAARAFRSTIAFSRRWSLGKIGRKTWSQSVIG